MVDAQAETSDEWHSSGVGTGTGSVKHLCAHHGKWDKVFKKAAETSESFQMTVSSVMWSTGWREEMQSRGSLACLRGEAVQTS